MMVATDMVDMVLSTQDMVLKKKDIMAMLVTTIDIPAAVHR